MHRLSPRIQAVLNNFLDHRCRTFDNLAGGDLIDQVTWELQDGHGQASEGDDLLFFQILGRKSLEKLINRQRRSEYSEFDQCECYRSTACSRGE